MRTRRGWAALALAASIGASLAWTAGAAAQERTVDLRTGEARMARDPRLRLVWERLRQACRDGCEKADADAFERDTLDLVAPMGELIGLTPAQMRRHVAAIPRQMLQIAHEDPAVLADYDRFVVSVLGPP